MSAASDNQLTKWVAGESVHNDADNECCPDFSCCQTHYKASEVERILFRDRPELRHKLLMGFLAAAIAGEGKTAHIAGSIEGNA